MEPQTSVHERLNLLINHFAKGNKAAFAKEIGTLPSVIASIIGGRMSKPSFELLEKIVLRYPEVNSSWLLTGRGMMLIPEAPARVQLPYTPPTLPSSGGQFLPPGADRHLREFYAQQSADFDYLIKVGEYLEALNPSELMLDFTSRLPYTLNPDYEPDRIEPEFDEHGNQTA